MKTIGELRKLIKDCGGSFVLGDLRYTYQEGGDIDIHFRGKLFMWVSNNVDDSKEISETDVSVSDDFEGAISNQEETRKQLREKEREVENLKKANDELGKLLESCGLNEGKVEAYEKLFIGKNVTINQP